MLLMTAFQENKMLYMPNVLL